MYKNHEGYPAPTEGEAIRRASWLPKHIWNRIKLVRKFLDEAKLDVVQITVRDRKTKQKYTWEERCWWTRKIYWISMWMPAN